MTKLEIFLQPLKKALDRKKCEMHTQSGLNSVVV